MELIISVVAGIIVSAISYVIGIVLMPGSGSDDTECRKKHLRHGIETGISVAIFLFIYLLITGSQR